MIAGIYYDLELIGTDNNDYYKIQCTESSNLLVSIESDNYFNFIIILYHEGGYASNNIIMYEIEGEPRKVYAHAPTTTYYYVDVYSMGGDHTYNMTISINVEGGNTYIIEESDDDDDDDTQLSDEIIIIGGSLIVGSLVLITPNIEKYLTAIYKISELGHEVTNRALRNFLGLSRQTITDFFTRNSFFRLCVDIVKGTAPTPTKYILNDKGRKVISLIFHFRDYYTNKN